MFLLLAPLPRFSGMHRTASHETCRRLLLRMLQRLQQRGTRRPKQDVARRGFRWSARARRIAWLIATSRSSLATPLPQMHQTTTMPSSPRHRSLRPVLLHPTQASSPRGETAPHVCRPCLPERPIPRQLHVSTPGNHGMRVAHMTAVSTGGNRWHLHMHRSLAQRFG